jgi:uncharacterized protein (TIGR02246 family)
VPSDDEAEMDRPIDPTLERFEHTANDLRREDIFGDRDAYPRLRRAGWLARAALLVACQPAAPDRAEDRAAIHRLLVDYGRTLDARDFDGFAALFARDGVYVAGGSGAKPLSGRRRAKRCAAPSPRTRLASPSPTITCSSTRPSISPGPDGARARSQSLYMVPGEGGAPRAAMMAQYEDELVREEGRWKFARRTVRDLMPTPTGR